APYDRLMVTASAEDLAPPWLEQLAPKGRLVLPLSLAGPIQLSAAFARSGSVLASDSLTFCGFMPMQGDLAPSAPRTPDATSGPLVEAGRPCGFRIPGADARAGFETWLALTQPGYVRLSRHPEEAAAFGLQDERGAALLEWEGSRLELRTYGGAADAADRLVETHLRWRRDRPSIHQLQVIAVPAGGSQPEIPDTVRVIRRPRFSFFVRRP
ncbi:MAG: hypothetical protein J2P28_22410, partial [Actinobacteria bacterium]|nr:hypothetical protein [Actinomycetota bacterium]